MRTPATSFAGTVWRDSTAGASTGPGESRRLDVSFSELRDVALEIAREVSAIPAQGQPRLHDAQALQVGLKSTHLDIVTELDQATETAILRELAARQPGDGVLAEEGGARESASGYTWVIDPIDGTVNFLYGQPHWAISIGVLDSDGTAVAGVVHAPALGETYVAARGCGAHLVVEDVWTELTNPPECAFELALLTTGFSYDPARRVDMARALADFLPRIRDVRRFGSAAIDICNVAMGRTNGYYERDLKPWDRAAAMVIAAEVGLAFEVHGDPSGHNLTVCAPPELAQRIIDELAALGIRD